jgi:uncharacterized protein YbjQ (UPF0145 family)
MSDPKDLTRIEDLSEFLHEENDEIDGQFQDLNKNQDTNESLADLPPEIPTDFSLEETPSTDFDTPPDLPMNFESENHSELMSDIHAETLFSDESSILFNEENDNTNYEFQSVENIPYDPIFDTPIDQFNDENKQDEIFENSIKDEVKNYKKEDFEDLKTFVSEYTGLDSKSSANPPYSICLKNIIDPEVAVDILALLKEYQIVNASNEKDFIIGIKNKTLLIPKLSEFAAIFLAHKLRRFNIEIIVGLGHTIFNSSESLLSDKGTITKRQIKQNKKQAFKLPIGKTESLEMLSTTTTTLQGYTILKFLSVYTSTTMINQADYERLHFVQRQLENENIDPDDSKAFKKFKNAFEQIHKDLLNEVKNEALLDGANAIIGVSYQTNPTFGNNQNLYQIVCSGTGALIAKNEEHESE